jgi:hypothetical protein
MFRACLKASATDSMRFTNSPAASLRIGGRFHFTRELQMKNKLTLLAIGALLTTTACMSQEAREAENRKYREYEKVFTLAKKLFNKKHERDCVAGFKRVMHDPSSFQLAGDFKFDNYSSGVWMGSYRADMLVPFTAPVRAKNAYGGLILNDMTCLYKVDVENKQMVYVRVGD